MPIYEKIGMICVSMVAFQIIRKVGRIILIVFSKQLRQQPDLSVQGRWAVISGGTDGIGRAFVEAFASRGLNIMILDYSEDKLQDMATEIRLKYNVQTKYIATDFSQARSIYSTLEKQLAEYEVGILVNSLGLGYKCPELFIDVSNTDTYRKRYYSSGIYNQMLNTNIFPVTYLCRIILKGMYKRKRGIIINVSSTTAEITSPMLAVYAASKAYITKFTTDLSIEYRNHGIIIQCLQPGLIARNKNPLLSWLHPTPKQYVECAIKTLGVRNKTCGFLPHSVFLVLFQIMEKLYPEQTRNVMLRLMERLRNKILARQVQFRFSIINIQLV